MRKSESEQTCSTKSPKMTKFKWKMINLRIGLNRVLCALWAILLGKCDPIFKTKPCELETVFHGFPFFFSCGLCCLPLLLPPHSFHIHLISFDFRFYIFLLPCCNLPHDPCPDFCSLSLVAVVRWCFLSSKKKLR